MTEGAGTPRDRLQLFFREIIMGEPGIDRALADRVAARCVQHIDLLLDWDRNRTPRPNTTPTIGQQAPRPAGNSAGLSHVGPLRGGAHFAPTPTPAPAARPVAVAAARPGPAPAPAGPRAFDPYAFSVVVTLVKKGPDALLARLAEIQEVEHLRLLANAQHLGVDQKLTGADDLRQAIIEGAERRLAGRRAAAS